MSKKIKLDPQNARLHNETNKAQIKKSLEDLGAGRSVVIDNEDYLIAGNGVFEQAEALGIKTRVIESDGTELVVIKRTDLKYDDEKRRKLAIADNAAGETSEWNFEELTEDEIQEWGIEVQQDEQEEIDAVEDDFEVELPEEPISKLGDLYEIGEHRLLCGSSTETDTWEMVMNGHLCDLVVTDPPYNVDYTGKTKDALKIENDKKKDGDFYTFLYDFYTSLGIYTKAGGAWYVWHADSEGANFRLAMAEAGIMVKQCLIWKKNSMVMGRQDYHWQHEPCLYGWKEGAAHGWYTDRKQTTILEFDRPTRSKEHPTMKPIALIAYQIGNSSKSGDIVADGFLGSGSTMVASHQLKRKCYGMELDPKYCDVIVKRMLELDSKLLIKRNGNECTEEFKTT